MWRHNLRRHAISNYAFPSPSVEPTSHRRVRKVVPGLSSCGAAWTQTCAERRLTCRARCDTEPSPPPPSPLPQSTLGGARAGGVPSSPGVRKHKFCRNKRHYPLVPGTAPRTARSRRRRLWRLSAYGISFLFFARCNRHLAFSDGGRKGTGRITPSPRLGA